MRNLQSYYNDRAILAPTLEVVNHINDYISNLVSGELCEYLSSDFVSMTSIDNDSSGHLYTT